MDYAEMEHMQNNEIKMFESNKEIRTQLRINTNLNKILVIM